MRPETVGGLTGCIALSQSQIISRVHIEHGDRCLTRRSWCRPPGGGFQTVLWVGPPADEPRRRTSPPGVRPATPGASSSPPSPGGSARHMWVSLSDTKSSLAPDWKPFCQFKKRFFEKSRKSFPLKRSQQGRCRMSAQNWFSAGGSTELKRVCEAH